MDFFLDSLTLNADPKALAAFLVAAATTQGVDLGILRESKYFPAD